LRYPDEKGEFPLSQKGEKKYSAKKVAGEPRSSTETE